jgi:hypothetical protein
MDFFAPVKIVLWGELLYKLSYVKGQNQDRVPCESFEKPAKRSKEITFLIKGISVN